MHTTRIAKNTKLIARYVFISGVNLSPTPLHESVTSVLQVAHVFKGVLQKVRKLSLNRALLKMACLNRTIDL